MRENLDAPLRHRAALEPDHREGGDARSAHGFDRTLKLHQRPHGKACLGQPPVRALGVGDRERGEMHAGVAGQRRLEFAVPSGVSAVLNSTSI